MLCELINWRQFLIGKFYSLKLFVFLYILRRLLNCVLYKMQLLTLRRRINNNDCNNKLKKNNVINLYLLSILLVYIQCIERCLGKFEEEPGE